MQDDLYSYYDTNFREIVNCAEETDTEAIPLGITRKCELNEFVDAFMTDWTQQFDKGLPKENDSTEAFLLNRFCTFAEFEYLYQSPRNTNWNAPIFKMLGITDEEKQNYFKSNLTQDRDGYFKLMEINNPPLRTFFFPAIQS